MKERPILFSAPMVCAILEDLKTQTRRVWSLPKWAEWDFIGGGEEKGQLIPKDQNLRGWYSVDEVVCPYGKIGDRLWVREAWRTTEGFDIYPPRDIQATTPIRYEADGAWTFPDVGMTGSGGKYRPSMFMPRWASRITLEITGMRVERLNDCSETDAMAEGCQTDIGEGSGLYWFDGLGVNKESGRAFAYDAKEAYSWLWESINGDESWAANPWVWVIEFKRIS